jgi:uncharacterized protein YdeI (YjbR/CyaY-like superfamily)
MNNTDLRIDTYIQNAAPFAQPILIYIREQMHLYCEDITETIKWGMPHFEYKGAPFSYCAAFKQHCGLGFWMAELLSITEQEPSTEQGMGQFGKITCIDDLPNSIYFGKLCQQAMALHDAGTKLPSRSKPKSDPTSLFIPPAFMEKITEYPQALLTFEGFSYSKKKDYVEWYTQAKTDATREKRLAQTVEWLAEGKARNWKYEKC